MSDEFDQSEEHNIGGARKNVRKARSAEWHKKEHGRLPDYGDSLWATAVENDLAAGERKDGLAVILEDGLLELQNIRQCHPQSVDLDGLDEQLVADFRAARLPQASQLAMLDYYRALLGDVGMINGIAGSGKAWAAIKLCALLLADSREKDSAKLFQAVFATSINNNGNDITPKLHEELKAIKPDVVVVRFYPSYLERHVFDSIHGELRQDAKNLTMANMRNLGDDDEHRAHDATPHAISRLKVGFSSHISVDQARLNA